MTKQIIIYHAGKTYGAFVPSIADADIYDSAMHYLLAAQQHLFDVGAITHPNNNPRNGGGTAEAWFDFDATNPAALSGLFDAIDYPENGDPNESLGSDEFHSMFYVYVIGGVSDGAVSASSDGLHPFNG